MHPVGQGQSKIIAFSPKFGRNIDLSKPDSHYDSQVDPYISCILTEYICSKMQHECTKGGHSTQPLRERTYHV